MGTDTDDGQRASVEDYKSPVQVIALARKTLEQLRIDSSPRYFPERVIADARWDVVGAEIKALRVELSAYVLAEKLADDHYQQVKEIPFPVSPFQFFKERHRNSWWMSWFVQRRPVIYQKYRVSMSVDVARYLTYPRATIVAPEFGKPVQYENVSIAQEWPDRGV